MGNYIQVTAADGFEFPAYAAQPVGPAKGALVVLQEIFGVNAHIRAVVDGFAAQGYSALAPATFHRIKPGVELGYTADDITGGVALKAAVESLPAPGVLQDIQAAISAAAQMVSNGRVGVLGYCWGGLLTWRAACLLSGVAAAVPYSISISMRHVVASPCRAVALSAASRLMSHRSGNGIGCCRP